MWLPGYRWAGWASVWCMIAGCKHRFPAGPRIERHWLDVTELLPAREAGALETLPAVVAVEQLDFHGGELSEAAGVAIVRVRLERGLHISLHINDSLHVKPIARRRIS